eukprot:Gb_30790 [translate_table: standard]
MLTQNKQTQWVKNEGNRKWCDLHKSPNHSNECHEQNRALQNHANQLKGKEKEEIVANVGAPLTLTTQAELDEKLFAIKDHVNDRIVIPIFDSSSQNSLVSASIIKSLGLSMMPYPDCHVLHWMHKGKDNIVTYQHKQRGALYKACINQYRIVKDGQAYTVNACDSVADLSIVSRDCCPFKTFGKINLKVCALDESPHPRWISDLDDGGLICSSFAFSLFLESSIDVEGITIAIYIMCPFASYDCHGYMGGTLSMAVFLARTFSIKDSAMNLILSSLFEQDELNILIHLTAFTLCTVHPSSIESSLNSEEEEQKIQQAALRAKFVQQLCTIALKGTANAMRLLKEVGGGSLCK